MPTHGKIDYIELPAANFEAVEQFYTQVFGWTFLSYGPNYHAFNDGKMDGGFYPSDQHSSAKDGAALIIFYSNDIATTYKAIVDAGGTILKEIFSFPGGRRFHFADPSNNELAVWTDIAE